MPISHTFINRPFSPPAGAGFQLLPSKSTELTQFGGDEISWQLIVYKPKDAMDLISAAGLVAPVMELFTLVLRCLTENKRYVEEFETLCVQLDFQRTCFVEEIRGLLSIISTTNEDSSAMIENPACQLWKDRILDERLGSLFGEWFEKWTSTLNLIYENMYALHDDIKSFMSHFVSNVSLQVCKLGLITQARLTHLYLSDKGHQIWQVASESQKESFDGANATEGRSARTACRRFLYSIKSD